jgi:hypothetical protein
VRLKADIKTPEPESFRVAFPGGDVDVVRTSNNEFWVHVRVNKRGDGFDLSDGSGRDYGQILDARLDSIGKSSSEMSAGDFADPNLYHLAVRIGT